MRRRLTILAAAVAASAILAMPASAHPVNPPGLGGDTQVAFSGSGSSVPHTLGLACAEDRSPAIAFLPPECVIGFGRS
jgi:hypothetical protein